MAKERVIMEGSENSQGEIVPFYTRESKFGALEVMFRID